MTIPLGALAPITATVRSAPLAPATEGALATPATSNLVITLPDLTTVNPAMSVLSVGVLGYDYPTVLPGRHTWRVTTTGPATAATGEFDVFAADPGWIFSLRDGKKHLQMDLTDTSDDDELGDMMSVVTEIVEQIVGPVVARPYTDRVRDGGGSLLLPRFPVVSVTSVTSVRGGTTWTTGLDADLQAGIVYLTSGASFSGGPWNVAYVAGYPDPPKRFKHAGKEMLRHLWTTQRGAGSDSYRPLLTGEEQVFSSAAGQTFSIPKRVIELLAYDQVPGFA